MEAKINVAEILKDKPENTKLYSPLFGDVYFSYIKDSIINVKHHGGITKFFDNSRYYNYPESEPLLFPSKEMRDWSKYAWKRGDVLVSDDGCIDVIFDKWYDDTYTSFNGKYYLDSENENDIVYIKAFICTTERFSLEDKESFLCYINTIEERLGGKLNRETLEIEKTQPEFKDGDILSNPSTALPKNHIFIFSKFNKYKDFEHHVALTASGEITIPTSHGAWCRKDSGVKYATEEEKQQLFEALAKEGKVWDTEKKAIVDIKTGYQFKPFDKVLVRDSYDDMWRACLFSHIRKGDGRYVTTCLTWKFCIPYIGNESLLGTTKDVEV
jgi:hypothetical protein